MKLNNKFWFFAGACIAFAGSVFISLVVLFWHQISVPQKIVIISLLKEQFWYFFSTFVFSISVFGFALDWIFRFYIIPLNQISEQMLLMNTVNPSLRVQVDGSREVMRIVKIINQNADGYEALKHTVKKKVDEAKSQVDSEKNILAAIMTELPQGVLICNAEGTILLYNRKAKSYLGSVKENKEQLDSTNGFMGLGRSIYSLIEKDLISHALDDIHQKIKNEEKNVVSYFVVVTKKHNLVKVEAVPVLDQNRKFSGFILILFDITRQIESENQKHTELLVLSGRIRASVAGIKTATELLSQFPEMVNEKRNRFVGIISKEIDNLKVLLDTEELETSGRMKTIWPRVIMPAPNFVLHLKKAMKDGLKIDVDRQLHEAQFRIKVDIYSLGLAMMFVVTKLLEIHKNVQFALNLKRKGGLAVLDLLWKGEPVKIEILREWENNQIEVKGQSLTLTLKEILDHHDAAIWPCAPEPDSKRSSLRIYLPVIETDDKEERIAKITILPSGRPEFYDFDLFSQDGQNTKVDNRLLSELPYTVFDTETTGLDPRGGDEIISIGAIRVINCRLLKEEYFDQLIDPRRSLPYQSIKIHGITNEMVKGKPVIDDVLPVFHRFSEDTVLIGHNVAFDMRMLQIKEKQTGIKFINPVLDTMHLSAVINPAQHDHSLSAIAKRLGVEVVNRHTAFGDALTTGEIFLKLLPMLSEKGIFTLKEARLESQHTYYARLKY